MSPIDWLFYIATKAGFWVELLAYLVGLVVSVCAYRQCRKAGYLAIGIYFLLAVSALTIVPVVRRAIRQRWYSQHELSPEAREQYTQESVALHQKYYPAAPAYATANITFPLGPILLVTGIWVLARRESRRSAEQIGSANAAQRGVADL